jgi:hypothetical protein
MVATGTVACIPGGSYLLAAKPAWLAKAHMLLLLLLGAHSVIQQCSVTGGICSNRSVNEDTGLLAG